MSYSERFVHKEGEGHNRVMIVTGVSSCGKDFLIAEARKTGVIPPEVSTFSVGEELFDAFHEQYPFLQSRDDIKSMLSREQIAAGLIGLIDHVLDRQPVIVNGHIMPVEQGDYMYRKTFDFSLHPQSYLYVWSDPEIIKARRDRNQTRNRPVESVEDIAFHQDAAMAITEVVAKYNGAGMISLWNREDNLGENLDRIQDKVDELSLRRWNQRSFLGMR